MSLKLAATLALVAMAATALTAGKPALDKANDQPQFLYRIQVTRPAMLTSGPTPEEAAAIAEHFNYLKELTAKGVLILAGRTQNNDETTFGIVIFRAASEEAARAIMNADPSIAKGVQKATLFPYRVALMEGRPIP